MNLELKSVANSKYPRCGFFVEGADLNLWISELDKLNLDIEKIELHPLPSYEVNSIWGCLVLVDDNLVPLEIDRWTGAHHISNKLIIPEKTDLTIVLTSFDMVQLFAKDRYVFHMDFGFYKLEQALSFSDYIKVEELKEVDTTQPVSFERLSHEIHAFRVVATPEEDLQSDIDEKPIRESLKKDLLSLGERVRLKLYKSLLNTSKDPNGNHLIDTPTGEALSKLANILGLNGSGIRDNIIRDFEDLLERNKKEVDKLMDLLENNPEDALKYAIPLDEHGYSRGKSTTDFTMQNQGSDFSLFKNLRRSGSGGVSVDLGDEFFRLQEQYKRTAKALKDKGNYEKAAFVYLKLLKDYNSAAVTLLEGGYFEKAAYIYMKYVKNELKAAAAYEEGKIYDKAIELYEKNGKLEKVGDLYMLQGDHVKSKEIYRKLVDEFIGKAEYINASLLSRNKLHDHSKAQDILLDGWKKRSNEYSCLSYYFKNIVETEEAWHQLNYIKDHWVDTRNDVNFLKVVKSEYKNRVANKGKIRELGYILISDLLERDVISSTELVDFNKDDKRLSADTMRYNINKVRRMKG